MRTVFEAEGEIRGTDLLAALVALWREGMSGSLQFSRSGATAGFELAAGEIVTTASSDPRFETAAILLRGGKIDEATLERLAPAEGVDRARTALQAGVLTKREWRWGEKIRAVEVLSDLLTWIEGDYWIFRTGVRESGEFRLTVPRLILELFLRSRDRGLVLHYLGGVDVALVRAPDFDSEFATFGLTADAESVVRLIDGESTAAEIASEAPAEPFAVEKLLAALVTLGLIHPEYAAAAAAPARSPALSSVPNEPQEEEQDEAEASERETAGESEREDVEESAPTEDAASGRADLAAAAAEDRYGAGPADGELEAERAGSGPDEMGPETDETEPDVEMDEERMAEPPTPLERASLFPAAGIDPVASSAADLYEPELEAQSAPVGGLGDLENLAPEEPGTLDRPLDMTTGIGMGDRRRQKSGAPWVAVLTLLAAIVAGVLFWKSRTPGAPGRSAAVAAPSPTKTVNAPTAAPPVSRVSRTFPTPAAATPARHTAAAAATRPPRPAPTTAPTLRPTERTAAPSIPARPSVPERKASSTPTTREAWMDRAARDRKRANADRRARYAIQLELACEVESLVDAWKHDRPSGTMWVLATPFQGRSCFRVLWGRYPTIQAAKKALASAPGFFSTARNRPAVVSVR